MSPPAAPPEATEPAHWARRTATRALETFSLKQLFFGAFLLVLVVSMPFGGMERVAQEKPAPVKVDRKATVAPFTITLKGAWRARDVGVSAAPRIDGRYLIVGALVRTSARTSVPGSTLRDALRLEGVEGFEDSKGRAVPAARSDSVAATTMLVDADFHAMSDLPPDTTYGMYWIFELAPGHAAPDDLDVVLRRHTYRESSIDQVLGYFDPEPVGRATLPVRRWKVLEQTSEPTR